MSDDRTESLRDIGSKPVRIAADGRLYIGDDEFYYPVQAGSVRVEPLAYGSRHCDADCAWTRNGNFNKLTLTLLVGDVTVERRQRPSESQDS